MIGRVSGSQVGQRLPALTDRAVLDGQGRAVRHLVTLALAAVVVRDQHFAGTRNDDQVALAVGDVAHGRGEADRAVRLGFDARRHRRTRCRTTDVERTHGQLRARLADRLRGDDADRFADVDQARRGPGRGRSTSRTGRSGCRRSAACGP